MIRHLLIERERVCGLSIWLYNDFRTPASAGRPRGFNDKGVVDEYRRPKEAYDVVRRCFAELQQHSRQRIGAPPGVTLQTTGRCVEEDSQEPPLPAERL